ncbi:MAG: DUF2846 domain-containing protein [Nitrospira sp. CG24E]|nr:MAG: DUF2846 domain-containing protein [Nitrospira sp. CG24E]
MNQNISLLRSMLACLLSVVALSGCAFNKPQGPVFVPHMLSQSGSALIYVYRPKGEHFGSDRAYSLVANGKIVTDLLYEGYYPFEVGPGKLSLAADLKKTVGQQLRVGLLDFSLRPDAATMDIETKAGSTYFIKFRPEAHAFSFEPRLYLIANDVGDREIRDCKLIVNEK